VPGILGVPTGPTTTSITPERSTHISRAPHHVVRLASAHTRSGPSSARSRIQRMLPRTGRGSQLVLVWGWPTPIRMNARTESRPERESPFMVPPLATRPGGSFGRRGERDQLRLVHQDKSLPRDQGERPLSYSVLERTQAYLRCVRRERRHEQDVRKRPLQFGLVPGQGPLVGWCGGSREASQPRPHPGRSSGLLGGRRGPATCWPATESDGAARPIRSPASKRTAPPRRSTRDEVGSARKTPDEPGAR
jgi:hypothetical protein